MSLIIHLVLLLILVEATRNNVWWNPPDAEGNPRDRVGGGGGGRQVDMIALPEAARRPTPVVKVPPPPPPVPVPVITPTQIPPPTPAPPADTLPKTSGGTETTGSGGGTGGTTGTGNGPGSGPGTGPGTGGAGTPDSSRTAARDPEPRQLILIPFDFPPSMRGHTIQVTFFVLSDGQVDHVLFSEDIPDRGYAKRLDVVMRAYRFRPARSAAGQPVPGHTTVSITF